MIAELKAILAPTRGRRASPVPSDQGEAPPVPGDREHASPQAPGGQSRVSATASGAQSPPVPGRPPEPPAADGLPGATIDSETAPLATADAVAAVPDSAVTAPVDSTVHAGEENAPVDLNPSVDLGRLGWLVIVVACLVAVTILVLEGYYGYAGVTFAVALSAGINLL
jgi:hypothetical protein